MSESGNESLQGQADVTPDTGGCATLRDVTGASENQTGVSGDDPGASGDAAGASPDQTVEAAAATSQARIDANRANAQHSTGPRTPEGKARVARNAIRHGLLSRQAVLPTDNRAEFDEFHAAMWLDLKAVGAREEMLAERIVAQYWRLRRAMRVEACLFDRDAGRALAFERSMHLDDVRPSGDPVHPAALGEAIRETMGAKHNPYEALRRYERTIQRDLDSCSKQFEDLQRTRRDREKLEGPAQVPLLPDDSARAAAWPAPAACPDSPAARGEADDPHGSQPGGPEPVGFVSQPSDAAASGVYPPGAATTEAWASALPAVASPWGQAPGDANHGTRPVGFVSQRAAVARDATGRRLPSPQFAPPQSTLPRDSGLE
jgi:hypothetical protein